MAYPIAPLINGKSYEWADIALNIMGVPIVGITAIEYKDNTDMQNVWGAGSMPSSRGYGKYEAMAKITLKMEEVENLQAASPDGRLQSIPEFDIPVAFLDSSLLTRIHKIRNCRFKNNERNTKQGDTSIDVELELIVSHIDWK